MNSELGFNAYVLLGNALNYLVNGAHIDSGAELNAPAAAITSLYRRIEPLNPTQVLPAVAELSPDERSLLDRCCRYCLRALDQGDVPSILGLPWEVAQDVLTQLALERPPNRTTPDSRAL